MTLTDHIFGVSTQVSLQRGSHTQPADAQLSVQFSADTVPFDRLMGLSFSVSFPHSHLV